MEVKLTAEQKIFQVINAQQFMESTTVTTIDSTMASLKDVTFPSVWMCNTNQVNIALNGKYLL
jgi:hypothetical protein